MPFERTLTTAQIAEAFGVGEQAVSRWCQRGCPHDNGGAGTFKPKLFNEQEVALWRQNRGEIAQEKQLAAGISTPTGELTKVRIRKEKALARRAELEVAREEGKLIDKAEVERGQIQKVLAVRAKLMQMGAALAPQMEGMDAAARQALIDSYTRQICEDFARGT